MPKNPKSAVVLISGSGPQDRDQLFMGHKTFLVLADYLSRNGIAVLRYDDRGVGQSEGDFENSTSLDFSKDASAAVDFLSNHNKLSGVKIGLIGHSEGGLIAPIVASANLKVDFAVLLAGPSRGGRFVSENQMKNILKSNGVSEDTANAGSLITSKLNAVVLNSSLPENELRSRLKTVYEVEWNKVTDASKKELRKLGGGSVTENRIKMLTSKWYKGFIEHEPYDYLSKLKIPVYALYAEKDVQIDSLAHISHMRRYLNNSSKVEMLLGHNHLFQMSSTGVMSEYSKIEHTLSDKVLSSVLVWIKSIQDS
jgi:pimeloyl-ACP methyl ester carboxylesterase